MQIKSTWISTRGFLYNGEYNMNKNKSNLTFPIISILIPLIYFSMYLPIWDSKELHLSSNIVVITFFVLQCSALLAALLRLTFEIYNKEYSILLIVPTIISILILCFVGYVFILNLYEIPIMPQPK